MGMQQNGMAMPPAPGMPAVGNMPPLRVRLLGLQLLLLFALVFPHPLVLADLWHVLAFSGDTKMSAGSQPVYGLVHLQQSAFVNIFCGKRRGT